MRDRTLVDLYLNLTDMILHPKTSNAIDFSFLCYTVFTIQSDLYCRPSTIVVLRDNFS